MTLLIFSAGFYGYWDHWFLAVPLGSVGINYLFLRSPKIERNKCLFAAAIALNLGLLFYFKYLNFFATNVSYLTGHSWVVKDIVLPLGISFLTFQQISCLYANFKKYDFQYSLYEYALYILIFPHQIAGPIVRYGDLLPQIRQVKIFAIDWRNFGNGSILFILGLSKKVLFADTFAETANSFYSLAVEPNKIDIVSAWIGSLSYSFQLYFDFSGYADMAVGLGLLFNFRFPINFNSPYKADSMIDFWRRWHISLSQFLRDHLFIPLGGNRLGRARKYLNIFITMLLGGLWHGAGWPFLIWGSLHGLAIGINHFWRDFSFTRLLKLPRFVGVIFTFLTVNILWIYFRAPSVSVAHNGIKKLVAFEAPSNVLVFERLAPICMVIGGLAVSFLMPNSMELLQRLNEKIDDRLGSLSLGLVGTVVGFLLFLSCLMMYLRASAPNYNPQFIYFQF